MNSTVRPIVAKPPTPMEVTPLLEMPPAATAKDTNDVDVEAPKEDVPLKVPDGMGKGLKPVLWPKQRAIRAKNRMAFCMSVVCVAALRLPRK